MSSRLCRASGLLWRDCGDSLVVLAPDAEHPVLISAAGRGIWFAVDVPLTLPQLRERLSRASASTDWETDGVDHGVSELVAAGLLIRTEP